MSVTRRVLRQLLRGGVPALVGALMLAGPGIGPRVFAEQRDPAPLEAVAIGLRPCELLERDRLVVASALEVHAYAEGARGQDDISTCGYEADGGSITLGLLTGEALRFSRGDEFTQADFLAELLETQPAAARVRGVGEGALRMADGTLWARQGDLIVQVTATGVSADGRVEIARLALRAAGDRT